MRKTSLILFLIISYAIAMPVFAQEKPPAGSFAQELKDILTRLTNWMLALLIAVTVAFIVYAAYLYLTSQGDVEKVKTANRVILYAAIAVGVALLAWVFVALIGALVGAPSSPSTGPGTTVTEPGFQRTEPGSIKEEVRFDEKAGRFHYTATSEYVKD